MKVDIRAEEYERLYDYPLYLDVIYLGRNNLNFPIFLIRRPDGEVSVRERVGGLVGLPRLTKFEKEYLIHLFKIYENSARIKRIKPGK